MLSLFALFFCFLAGAPDLAQAGFNNWSSAGPVGKAHSVAVSPNGTIAFAGGNGSIYQNNLGTGVWKLSMAGSLVEKGIVFKPGDSLTAYAAAFDGIHRTTDGGASWTILAAAPPQVEVLAVDSASPAYLYAATTSGLFRSADGGNTWNSIVAGTPGSLPAVGVSALAVESGYIYAGAIGKGVWKSPTSAINWTDISFGASLNAATITALVVDPTATANIYAVSSSTLYATTDGGLTAWTMPATPFSTVSYTCLGYDAANSALYVGVKGTPAGLFRVSPTDWDWGLWGQQVSVTSYSVAIGPNPMSSGNIFVGTDNGVLRNGDGFLGYNSGLTLPSIKSFAEKFGYYAGGGGGVWQSNDLASWIFYPPATAPPYLKISALALDATYLNPPVPIFAGVTGLGSFMTYETADLAVAGWIGAGNKSGGLPGTEVAAMVRNATDTFMAVVGDGVYRWDSANTSWLFTANTGLSNTNITGMALSAAPALYASTKGGGIFRSVDGGTNWTTPTTQPSDLTILTIAVSPSDAARLYAGSGTGTSGVLHRSTDSGVTWTGGPTFGSDVTAIAVHSSNPSIAVIGTAKSGAFITTDGGVTVQPFTGGLPTLGSAFPGINSVNFSANQPSLVTLGLEGAGVYKRNVSPLLSAPAALDFGTILYPGNTTLPVTLQNSGSFPMNVYGFVTVVTGGSHYSAGNGACPATPFVLNPGQSCALNVTFTPLFAGGPHTDTLIISTDAPGSPQSIPITGKAVAVNRIWAAPVSGNWSDAAKWSPAGVPAITDTVAINVSGSYTVTLDQPATVAELVVGGVAGVQTLDITTNALTISGFSSFNSTAKLTSTTGGSISINGGADIAGTVIASTTAGGGTINFNGGNTTVKPGAVYTIGGTASGTTSISGAAAVYFNNVAQTKNFNLSGSGIISGTGSLNVATSFIWDGGSVGAAGGTGGQLNLQNSSTSSIIGTGITPMALNTFTIANAGIVTMSGIGSIDFLNGAAFQNNGIFDLASDAGFTAISSETFSNNSGALFRKSAGSGTSSIAPIFISNGGSMDIQSGVISFGTGFLTLSGTTSAKISGPVALTQYGELNAYGMIIGGALAVNLTYTPVIGDSYTLLTCGLSTCSGTFATTNLPSLGFGKAWALTYSPANVVLSVAAGIAISTTTLPNGTYGVAFNQSVTANGGTAPFTYSVNAGALPSGLSLGTSTGAITGTPTIAGTYNFTIRVTDTLGNIADQSYTVVISKIAATVTLGSLSQTYNGSLRDATATTSPPGLAVTFTYNGSAAAPANAGNYIVTASINDVNYYGSASDNLFIGTAVLGITAVADGKTYGSADPLLTYTTTGLVAPDSMSGVLSRAAGENVGSYAIGQGTVAVSAPGNYTVTFTGANLVIGKAAPVITWANPAAITYGTPLNATQLNAGSGGVAGTFIYTPVGGTVLNAGAGQTLSATFSPTDTTNYNTPAAATVLITVAKADPVISWSNPAAITYGTALGGSQLNATASASGSFAYTPASGTLLNAGAGQTLSATFTPTDSANYNTPAAATVLITVAKADPVISWSNPAAITYGTALGGSQLNATATAPGTFAYTPASGTLLSTGAGQTLSATFTPTDSANYNTPAAATVLITVAKADPVISWSNPAAITYGTALGGSQLNATATAPGTFAYTPASGTLLSAGAGQTLSATFTPADTTNYNPAAATVLITVAKADPVISWANPAAITYGTPLSGTQLNATSGTVAGTFAYTPASGTLLTVGTQTVSVTFTPTDTINYSMQTAFVTVTVNTLPANQVITGIDGKTTVPITVAAFGATLTLGSGTLLTDASGNPISGTLAVTASVMSSIGALPTTTATAPTSDGKILSVLGNSIDITISAGAATVKTIYLPMIVNLPLTSTFALPGATVSYYSFDGTKWQLEGTAVVKSDNSVDMSVGHLSVWAVATFKAASVLPFSENFDLGALPAGWALLPNNGAEDWTFGTTGNATGGNGGFASIGTYSWANSELRLPALDMSAATKPALEFKTIYTGGPDTLAVDVSSDGGVNWTNVWSWRSTTDAPIPASVVTQDVSAVAAGLSNVMVRFFFANGDGMVSTWSIDDVRIYDAAGMSDTVAPVVSSFAAPSTSVTLAVSGLSITATDDTGVTGYMLSESATPPLATDTGWAAAPPAAHTFPTWGNHTLYAYAKDAAGNISAAKSAIVMIGTTDGVIVPAAATDPPKLEPQLSDALKSLNFAMKIETPTATDLQHGDVAPLVNGLPQPDGEINLGDTIIILRRVVGL